MKLDMNPELLEDCKNIDLLLDALNISKVDSNGKNYPLFIRIGFLTKQFENKISELKEENKSLTEIIKEKKDIIRELNKSIKLLKKDK